MDDAFRSFVLGLGILLGLVEGGENPAIAARLHRDADTVRLSVELSDFVSPSMRKLVDSGNAVSVSIEVLRDGQDHCRATRTMRKRSDPAVFSIADSGGEDKTLETESEEAAYLLLGRFTDFAIDEAERFAAYFSGEKPVVRISVCASVRVEGASEEESALLWNYKKPSREFILRSVTEVPY